MSNIVSDLPPIPIIQDEKVVFSAIEVGRCQRKAISPVPESMPMRDLNDFFQENLHVDSVPVCQSDNPDKIVGYILQEKFMAFLGQSPYHRDIYLRPNYTIKTVMDNDVVVLDSHLTLMEASLILMRRSPEKVYDPFVVVHKGKYLGISTVRSVMDGLNQFSTHNLKSCESAQKAVLHQPDEVDYEKLNLHFILEELNGLGGDLVFHQRLQQSDYLITIMDVSGKGLRASNMVMTIQSALITAFEMFPMVQNGQENHRKILSQLINRLNRLIAENTPFDMYATAAFFLVDTASGSLDYFDYGHTPVYLIREGKVFKIPMRPSKDSTGIPFFGIDPELTILPARVRIQPGDKIFSYTDGLEEARNVAGEEFGDERIIETLRQCAELRPREVTTHIKQTLEDFRLGNRVLDDLTLLCFEIR